MATRKNMSHRIAARRFGALGRLRTLYDGSQKRLNSYLGNPKHFEKAIHIERSWSAHYQTAINILEKKLRQAVSVSAHA